MRGREGVWERVCQSRPLRSVWPTSRAWKGPDAGRHPWIPVGAQSKWWASSLNLEGQAGWKPMTLQAVRAPQPIISTTATVAGAEAEATTAPKNRRPTWRAQSWPSVVETHRFCLRVIFSATFALNLESHDWLAGRKWAALRGQNDNHN